MNNLVSKESCKDKNKNKIKRKRKISISTVCILGTSACQHILVKDEKVFSSFSVETPRTASLYSSLVADILTKAAGYSHSFPSFSWKDLNPCGKKNMGLF